MKGTSKSVFVALLLLVMLAGTLPYLSAFGFGFVGLDDGEYITGNPNMDLPLPAFFRWAMTTTRCSNWHPLTWLSYALDQSIWGKGAQGHHLVNIALHALNSALVLLLCLRLYKTACPMEKERAGIFFALIISVFFALHPLHVESVAWISERKDVLYALFWLMSVYAYLVYAEARGAAPKATTYIASVLLFLLSLMSKPMAVTLPALLLVLDWYPLRRRLTSIQVALEKLPYFAISALGSYMTLRAHAARGTVEAGEGFNPDSLWVALKALAVYTYKTVIPVGLLPFYPLPESVDWVSAEYLVPLALVIACLALAWRLRHTAPVWSAGWLYMLLSLLPVLGLIKMGEQAYADRYMYLPMLGLLVPLGAALTWLWRQWPRAVLAPVILAMVGFGVLSARQVAVWRDAETLWTRVYSAYPEDPAVNYQYGKMLYDAGRYPEAIEAMGRVINAKPYFSSARYFRAGSRAKLGRSLEALGDLDYAIKVNAMVPETANPSLVPYGAYYRERAESLMRLGRYLEAASDYGELARRSPGNWGYRYDQGRALESAGDMEGAAGQFRAALDLRPSAKAYNQLALVLSRMGRPREAIEAIDRAIGLDPAQAGLYYNRGNINKAAGRKTEAQRDYEKAAALGFGKQ